MKYVLEVPDNKSDFAEEFFKTISFVKNIKQIASNEITNPSILQSINDYETGISTPTPLSLKELKVMLND
ncbi:MAG: hypothetical protein ACEQSR_14110 [Candidatus Methylacidiphilales bacterium]